MAAADQASVKNTFGGWCVENWDKNSQWPWVVFISRPKANRVSWTTLIKAWRNNGNWPIGPDDQKKSQKKYFDRFFSIAALPGISQQITPKTNLAFRPNYRLSISIGLRSLISLREKNYRNALEHLQPVHAKCGAIFFAPIGQCLNNIGKMKAWHWSIRVSLLDKMRRNFFAPSWTKPEQYWKKWRPVIGRYRFSPGDSPRLLYFCVGSHPLPLVMGGSMIPNIHPLTRYCDWHSWGENFRLLTWTSLKIKPTQVIEVRTSRTEPLGKVLGSVPNVPKKLR